MSLRNVRRMAASILKVGENRVWINPISPEELEDVITREDVRYRIIRGDIRKLPERGQSRSRTRHRRSQRAKGRRRGAGSRKGGANARDPRKPRWVRQIRAQRKLLRELKETGRIDQRTYRTYYRKAKGGTFKGRAHLEQQLRLAGLVKEGEA